MKEQTTSKGTISPSDLNKEFLDNIEARYGPIDYERDFFSPNLTTYYKVNYEDKKTGTVGHKLIPLASFGDSFNKLTKALSSLEKLSKTKETSQDGTLDEIAIKLRELFNKYRTHLRKNYPEHYKNIKRRVNELIEIGKINEGEELNSHQKFQRERVEDFSKIRTEMNGILTSLSNYENKTIEYYKENPSSFDVVFPTTLILDYIKDIKILLKEQE